MYWYILIYYIFAQIYTIKSKKYYICLCIQMYVNYYNVLF